MRIISYITRKNLTELLHINEPQAYRLLSALSKKGKLELVGKGRLAKYIMKK